MTINLSPPLRLSLSSPPTIFSFLFFSISHNLFQKKKKKNIDGVLFTM